MDCTAHKPIYFNCDHKRYNFWRDSSFNTKGDLSVYEYIKMVAANFTCCTITTDTCKQKQYKNFYIPKSRFVRQSDIFSPKLMFSWEKAVKHVLNCECGIAFPEDPYCCGCSDSQDKLKNIYIPNFATKQKKSKNWVNLNLVIHNILQDVTGNSCSDPTFCTC